MPLYRPLFTKHPISRASPFMSKFGPIFPLFSKGTPQYIISIQLFLENIFFSYNSCSLSSCVENPTVVAFKDAHKVMMPWKVSEKTWPCHCMQWGPRDKALSGCKASLRAPTLGAMLTSNNALSLGPHLLHMTWSYFLSDFIWHLTLCNLPPAFLETLCFPTTPAHHGRSCCRHLQRRENFQRIGPYTYVR